MILVIVDRLTKYAIFLPVRDTITATELADLFLEEVFIHYRMPEKFITDRDKLF